MTHTSGDAQSERNLNRRIADQASVVDLRVERARHKAIAARRSAAASLHRSAESHERAKNGLFDGDDERNHDRRQRPFAQDDRRTTERARHSADPHMADCKVLPFRPPRP